MIVALGYTNRMYKKGTKQRRLTSSTVDSLQLGLDHELQELQVRAD
jgi:hypothetical protein